MSHTPHDSPYRDAPSASPVSTASTAPSRHVVHAAHAERPARKPAVSHSPRQPHVPHASGAPHASHVSHVSHEAPNGKPARARSGRRRRRGGSATAVTELTSVPTSRNAYVATRAWLLAEHGPVCAYCGVRFSDSVMTLDHVAPRRGQTAYDRRDNLVLACPGCNMVKRDQAPLAFLLGSRIRAVNLLKYGSHLSQMLVDMARSLVPADVLESFDAAGAAGTAGSAKLSSGSSLNWATLDDLDGESPYRD